MSAWCCESQAHGYKCQFTCKTAVSW